MPKNESAALSLREIDSLRTARLQEISSLERERDRLKSEMSDLDSRIADLRGRRRPGRPADHATAQGAKRRRRRFKNAMSLGPLLESILQKADKPMKSAELEEEVRKANYKSRAKDLRSNIYQAIHGSSTIVRAKDKSGYVYKASAAK